MPKIKNHALIEWKLNRNQLIRNEFDEYMNEGRTWEYAAGKLTSKWGLSESTIYQIVKNYGNYKKC